MEFIPWKDREAAFAAMIDAQWERQKEEATEEVVVMSLNGDSQWTFRWAHDEGENGAG